MRKKISSALFIIFTIGCLYFMSKGLVGIAAAYVLITFHIVRMLLKIAALQYICKSDKLKIRDSIKEEIPRKFGHLELCYITIPMVYFSFNGTIHMILYPILGLITAFVLKHTGLLKKLVERKNKEDDNLGSTSCLIVGFLINIIIAHFVPAYAIPMMLAIMATTGDVAACIVGKLYGKHKIYKKKSLEGCLGFIALAFVSMYIFSGLAIWKLLIIAIVGALVELYSDSYDNLVGQLVCALVAFLII